MKREKHSSKYVRTNVAIALTLMAVILSVAITYTLATSSSNTPITIGGGIYPGAPSYTIWREGDHYFAKNSSGAKVFSGTNASQVINNAASNGGKIFLEKGTFLLDAPILLPSYTILEGSGFSTVLKRNANNVGIIRNKNPPSDPYGVTYTNQEIIIRDLKIDGGNASGYSADEWNDIINLVCVSRFTIENLIIENADGNNDAIDLDACGNGIVRNVVFNYIGGAAVHLTGLYSGWTNRSACSYCNVIDCYAKNTGFDRSVAAFNIWSDQNSIAPAVYNTFKSCIARDCYAGFGIDAYDPNSGKNRIVNCLVVNADQEGVVISQSDGNLVIGTTVMYCDRGIFINEADRNFIEDCFVKGTETYDGISIWKSSYNVVKNCIIKNNERDGIRLNGDSSVNSTGNVILNCYIYDDASPHTQECAIREWAYTDYTRITNCDCRDSTSGNNIRVVGANTQVHISYNGTSWIS